MSAPTDGAASAFTDALHAGDLAVQRGAPGEAIACYRQALTHVGAGAVTRS